MTQRAADDFAAIRKRMDELTAQEELKHAPDSFETDTGDEHTIAVQPSTGKRYKWINGSWTEESYEIPAALQGRAPETYSGYEINWDAQEDLGSIDHKPSQTWYVPQASIDCSVTTEIEGDKQRWTVDEHELTYEEWAKQGHTLLDYMI